MMANKIRIRNNTRRSLSVNVIDDQKQSHGSFEVPALGSVDVSEAEANSIEVRKYFDQGVLSLDTPFEEKSDPDPTPDATPEPEATEDNESSEDEEDDDDNDAEDGETEASSGQRRKRPKVRSKKS